MSWRDDVKATYWSLMAGPAVRVNELVSLYALAGAGTGRAEVKERISMPGYNGRFTGSERRTGFAREPAYSLIRWKMWSSIWAMREVKLAQRN